MGTEKTGKITFRTPVVCVLIGLATIPFHITFGVGLVAFAFAMVTLYIRLTDDPRVPITTFPPCARSDEGAEVEELDARTITSVNDTFLFDDEYGNIDKTIF